MNKGPAYEHEVICWILNSRQVKIKWHTHTYHIVYVYLFILCKKYLAEQNNIHMIPMLY